MGVRGDAIVQMDWITGQVVKQWEKSGILDNTLIIFTSDNGPVLTDGYDDFAIQKLGEHKPGGVFRGGKYSAFEAGTRVPTIVHCPAKVAPGVSEALMSQIDIYASLATMLQVPLASDEAIDSEDHLLALLNANKSGRQLLIEENFTLSLRDGNLKYIKPSNNTGEWIKTKKNIEAGMSLEPQLFDLEVDPSEQNNLATERPDTVTLLQSKLEKLVSKKQR